MLRVGLVLKWGRKGGSRGRIWGWQRKTGGVDVTVAADASWMLYVVVR